MASQSLGATPIGPGALLPGETPVLPETALRGVFGRAPRLGMSRVLHPRVEGRNPRGVVGHRGKLRGHVPIFVGGAQPVHNGWFTGESDRGDRGGPDLSPTMGLVLRASKPDKP